MELSQYQHIYILVGARIAQFRGEKKMSQLDLASKVGMSRASIVNIEKGRQHPPLHLLWQLADALQIDAHKLLPTRSEMAQNQTWNAFKMVEVAGSEVSAARLTEFLNIISS